MTRALVRQERDNAMRGVERLQEALREKTEAASRPRERATITPEGEGAEEPAVVGFKDRKATFTAVKKGERQKMPPKPKIEEGRSPRTGS